MHHSKTDRDLEIVSGPRVLNILGLIFLTNLPRADTVETLPPKATMTPSIKLNSGYEMPQVGFGLWKVDTAIASDVVYNAIKAGYRLFDGACGKSYCLSSSSQRHAIHRGRL